MADEIQLFPMNNGQYGGWVWYESNAVLDGAGEVAVPAVWPPAPEDRMSVSIGPSQTMASDSSSYDAHGDQLDENGDWVESPAFPDGYEMLARSYTRNVGAFTFDVSGVDVAAMDGLNLTIDFGGFGGAWLFGIPDGDLAMPGNPNYVASSGNITSNNQTVHLDWIGGSFADLEVFEALLLAKADTWPFAGDAATINLLEIVPDPYGGSPGAQEQVITIPLSGWQELVAASDWVSLVASLADRPDVFWGWQDLVTARDDSTLYTMRNWIGFGSAAFLNTGNLVTGVWLDVVTAEPEPDDDPRRLPDIAISATATLGIDGPLLRVGGLAESPVDRPILSHEARRRRGW